ncbi:MAG: 50S ribosomal protein L5 [Candidatus Aenigmarchaeota archaeon]|nr:50S ribosomal protein L5 [Candidatus Aenigmarchaeota archaeon]
MKDIFIEKIVLNIGIGKDGDIKNAKEILKAVTGRDPVVTNSKKRSTFNVAKGKPIGCMMTIRKDCEKLLSRLFESKEKKIKKSSFDSGGNFSFGIPEYINVPGVQYNPNIGILGFDVAVRLARPGYRITRKRLGSKISKTHVIEKEDAMDFVKKKFDVILI